MRKKHIFMTKREQGIMEGATIGGIIGGGAGAGGVIGGIVVGGAIGATTPLWHKRHKKLRWDL